MVADLLDIASSELIAFAAHLGRLHLFWHFLWRSHQDVACTVHCWGPYPLIKCYQKMCRGLLCLAATVSWVHADIVSHNDSAFCCLCIEFFSLVPRFHYSFLIVWHPWWNQAFTFFLLSFLLLLYVITSKNVVYDKKENHRVEHRNGLFKSAVRGDLKNYWVCGFYPKGIHLDKLLWVPNKTWWGSPCISIFCPENLSLIQRDILSIRRWALDY